jgi:hypothetical protein
MSHLKINSEISRKQHGKLTGTTATATMMPKGTQEPTLIFCTEKKSI